VTTPSKTCTACKKTKPETDFGFYARKDMRLPHCKDCARKKSRDHYRAKNPGARILAETVTDTGRVCTGCDTFKTWDCYPKLASSSTGHRPTCRICHNLKQRNTRARPPHTSPLDPDQYERLYRQQDGTCAVCPSTDTLHAHIHPTHHTAHLLCQDCLDCLALHADRLAAAVAYLTRDAP
jgi:hypothetical protein